MNIYLFRCVECNKDQRGKDPGTFLSIMSVILGCLRDLRGQRGKDLGTFLSLVPVKRKNKTHLDLLNIPQFRLVVEFERPARERSG